MQKLRWTLLILELCYRLIVEGFFRGEETHARVADRYASALAKHEKGSVTHL